jgi:hypothetical protein
METWIRDEWGIRDQREIDIPYHGTIVPRELLLGQIDELVPERPLRPARAGSCLLSPNDIIVDIREPESS